MSLKSPVSYKKHLNNNHMHKVPQRKPHKAMSGEQLLNKAVSLANKQPKAKIAYKSGMQKQDEQESAYKQRLSKSL